MLINLQEVMEQLKRAGVSVVFPGLLRFQAYQESKENFERSTGLVADQMLLDNEGTLERARLLIRRNGLDDYGVMKWEPAKTTGLDLFVERPPRCS